MEELGELFKTTREKTSISLKEASEDLEIKELYLKNIESGNIGSFKDIFVLKEYISTYAKYLGLDQNKAIDTFNEYIFDYTSKIPVKKIEKAVKAKQNEEAKDKKIASPYTKPKKERKRLTNIIVYVLIALLICLIVIWSVRQITVNNEIANSVSFIE